MNKITEEVSARILESLIIVECLTQIGNKKMINFKKQVGTGPIADFHFILTTNQGKIFPHMCSAVDQILGDNP